MVGYLLVNAGPRREHRLALNAILALGAGYTLLDSLYSLRGRVFLGRLPLAVSLMEALFIGLLCYFHGGLESPFRFYYLLSLICCRHPPLGAASPTPPAPCTRPVCVVLLPRPAAGPAANRSRSCSRWSCSAG